MRTFLLPTKRSNVWLNPLDGKTMNIKPLSANSNNELVEYIADEGSRPRLKKHPAPSNVSISQRAPRGQLNDRDYNQLIQRGQNPQDIATKNNMFLLQNLRNQQ